MPLAPRRAVRALLASAFLLFGVATAASAQDVERLQAASAAAESGDHADAAQIYERVLEDGAVGSSAPAIHYAAAISLAQAGGEDELSRAFEHLRAALLQDAVSLGEARDHDALAPLREDPRWETLMSEVTAARAGVDEALREELLAMEEEDQRIRRELIAAGAATPDPELVARMHAIDSSNTARLKEIIDAVGGWPSVAQVGRQGADAAFLIVQHADRDPAFQKRVLPLLREAYENGEASGENVALLTDRVRVAEGREQLYGTQTHFEDGEIVFDPIAERGEVDERRAAMGLMPLEEYAAFLREAYQQPGDTRESDAP